MNRRIYRSALTHEQRSLWNIFQYGTRGSRWTLINSPRESLVWSSTRSSLIWSTCFTLLFGILALIVEHGQSGTNPWVLWVICGVGAVFAATTWLITEKFVLDPGVRCWKYVKGIRLYRIVEESGTYDELNGLVLQKFKGLSYEPAFDFYVVVLEFADGIRFCDLTPSIWNLDAARYEARRLSAASKLTLIERLDSV